jgi:hypothetical protein
MNIEAGLSQQAGAAGNTAGTGHGKSAALAAGLQKVHRGLGDRKSGVRLLEV